MKTLILALALIFSSIIGYSQCTHYSITEDITITGGQSYENFKTTGTYLRTLKTIYTNCDSIITTTLKVNGNSTFSYGTIPTTGVKAKDIELYKLYLKYCNTIVNDTVKIVGYKTVPLAQNGIYLTQNIVCSVANNYNPYRLKKWKNIQSTETRVPTFSAGKEANWSTIIYPCLQRFSSATDFYAYYYPRVKYSVTENITITGGQKYADYTTTGKYTRLFKTSGRDSIVTTNLTVTGSSTFSYGTVPTTLNKKDIELYKLYLTYCNKIVYDTTKIVGYATVPYIQSGEYVTQNIVCTINNNYNPYRLKKWKNVPSTETRMPTFPAGKVENWTTIIYPCLQRQSTTTDFYAWYVPSVKYSIIEDVTLTGGQSYYLWTTTGQHTRTLKSTSNIDSIVVTNITFTGSSTFSYGTMPTTIPLEDQELYKQYLAYCNTIVNDTVKIVGYKTTPAVQNGNYLNGNSVVTISNNYNPYRLKKWKNVPSTETRVPTFPTGKLEKWIKIIYPCLQRKSSSEDFYSWYVPPITPKAPTVGTITQPTCSVTNGSVVLNGLPSSGTWTLTRLPEGAITTGTGTSTTRNINAGTYTYKVTNSFGRTSPESSNIVINDQPITPTAPTVGSIIQPTCTVATGSIVLNGLPSGNWTLTRLPSGITTTGTGTSVNITLNTGTYTYKVTNSSGCVSPESDNIVINSQPITPKDPTIASITQPTCYVATGAVMLTGLPSDGWTLNRSPGGVITTGTGTSVNILLNTGIYTYKVTNSVGCVSPESIGIIINSQPNIPTAPLGTNIIQPTCTVTTGSVTLNGLPASGTWTLTRSDGVTTTGTGISTTINNLNTGSYIFKVYNSDNCVSPESNNIIISVPPNTPSTPTIGTITQPTCTVATGNVVLTGLPSSWTLTRSPGNVISNGIGTSTTVNLNTGTYTYKVTNPLGCTSIESNSIVINSQPITPTTPTIGTVTQPTCTLATGSVVLNGLPSGAWTLTRSPGGVTNTGTGTSITINNLNSGNYTYNVTNSVGCVSPESVNVVINAQPITPTAPIIGTITQPTCTLASGSVILNGLPSDDWTLTRLPGGIIYTGTGPSTTINLNTGSYTFKVTNSSGCSSDKVIGNTEVYTSTSAVVNRRALPITTDAGNIQSISIYHNGGTGKMLLGIYSDLNGSPSTRLGVTDTTIVNTTTGWQTVSLKSPVSVTSGGKVWLSWVFEKSITVRYTAGTPGRVQSSETWSAGMPSTFGAATTGTNKFSIYCTYASPESSNVVINSQPITPTAPLIGTITQPTATVATGSVVLNGLPSGAWTLTRSPGSVTTIGTGTSTTIILNTGVYTYKVTNSVGCISLESNNIVINAQPTKYLVTEDITISAGGSYNGWTTAGQRIRNLTSKSGLDSTVTTNLYVVNLRTLPLGVMPPVPTEITYEYTELYNIYLIYCNTVVTESTKICGYKTDVVQTGNIMTQNIVINVSDSYNPGRLKVYKNVPSTETRLPVMNVGKTLCWTTVNYTCLQRESGTADFYVNYTTLPMFTIPSTIPPADQALYNQYLIYCNRKVTDIVNMAGYATVPLVKVGNLTTQSIVCSVLDSYNPTRYKTYKNVPSTETRVPTLPAGQVLHWTPIGYWVLQRLASVEDFYAWYYPLPIKPTK